MASNGGVRTCMASTPVPSPTPGAAHDAAPSTENASMPVTSATQNESYPRRPPRLAKSTTAAVPERINGAAVTPSGLPPADAAGATDGCAVSMTATMRLASDDVWRESDQVIRTCGGSAVAFGRRVPTPVRPQSRGQAGTAAGRSAHPCWPSPPPAPRRPPAARPPPAPAAQPAAWHDTGKLPASTSDRPHGADPGLVKVNVPESRRLARLISAPMSRTARDLGYAWPRWRRRYQARARWHYYHAQLLKAARVSHTTTALRDLSPAASFRIGMGWVDR